MWRWSTYQVHKTSVQVEQKQKEERAKMEKQQRVRMAKVLEADMEVGEALLRVCLQLIGQGVCPGDAGAHAALNAELEAARQVWQGVTREDEKD
jgi:hypothetical protein